MLIKLAAGPLEATNAPLIESQLPLRVGQIWNPYHPYYRDAFASFSIFYLHVHPCQLPSTYSGVYTLRNPEGHAGLPHTTKFYK